MPEVDAPPSPHADKATGFLLFSMRTLLDEVEELNSRLSAINASLDSMKRELLSRAEAEGVSTYKAEGVLSVSITEKQAVDWDRSRFDEIAAAFVAEGHPEVLYRNFSASKIEDFVRSGGRLPDGVSLKPFRQVSTRRL